MHISEVERTPNLVAAQFLPERERRKLDRLIARAVHRTSRRFQIAIKAARRAAQQDLEAYENNLCQQAAPLGDLPW